MKNYQGVSSKGIYLFLVALAFAFQPWLAADHSHSSSHHHHHAPFTRGYDVTNIVSNLPGLAPQTDPNLHNPWGLIVGLRGNLLVAINGSGSATLYKSNGIIDFSFNVDDSPTGVVKNLSQQSFLFGPSHLPARLLFAAESGQILAFNRQVDPNNALVVIDRSGSPSPSIYKGLALAGSSENQRIYAADFHNCKIDVFDNHFTFIESLTDPNIPAGFAPFNIVNFGGKLYVTYALQKQPDRKDDQAGPGNGFVSIFNPEKGTFKLLISNGNLNSPWGLALAPNNFGEFSNALLVGNFGDGHINAYNPRSGKFLGQLTDASGNPIFIDGLWSLEFQQQRQNKHGNQENHDFIDLLQRHHSHKHEKNSHKPGNAILYFTAGLNDENDGLVGFISPHGQHK